jgi:hypothetical protein
MSQMGLTISSCAGGCGVRFFDFGVGLGMDVDEGFCMNFSTRATWAESFPGVRRSNMGRVEEFCGALGEVVRVGGGSVGGEGDGG